jgi:hypothetical protein
LHLELLGFGYQKRMRKENIGNWICKEWIRDMMGEQWEQFEEQLGNLLGTHEELLVELYVSSWCPRQVNKT